VEQRLRLVQVALIFQLVGQMAHRLEGRRMMRSERLAASLDLGTQD
jgi:hypothetical protein